MNELAEKARREKETRDEAQKARGDETKEFLRQHQQQIDELRASDPDVLGAALKLGNRLRAEMGPNVGASCGVDFMAYAWNDPQTFRAVFYEGIVGDYLHNRLVKTNDPRLNDEAGWTKVKVQVRKLYDEQVAGFARRIQANGYQRLSR